MKNLTTDQILVCAQICIAIDMIAVELDADPLELLHYLGEIMAAVNDKHGHIFTQIKEES